MDFPFLVFIGFMGTSVVVTGFSAFTWWSRRGLLQHARKLPSQRPLPPLSLRRYPLQIETDGRASRIAPDVLRARLKEWARTRGFHADLRNENRMRFTRGSTLLTSVAFGVRYIPTTVCVDIGGQALRWTFHTGSALQAMSAADQEEACFEIGLFLDALEGGCLSDPFRGTSVG